MSLDPNLGHLYNDHTASIDAKEQLRMREVNAREQRHLVRDKYVIERARHICERSRKWEHAHVKQQIKKIRDRTLSLDLSLKQEARLQNGDHGSKSTTGWIRKSSVFSDIPREVQSAPEVMSVRDVTKSNSFKRRSRNVVRSLLRMYDRCDERKRVSEGHPFKLEPSQINALQKAKLVLKGTQAEGEISKILERNSETSDLNRIERGKHVYHIRGRHGEVIANSGLSSISEYESLSWTRLTKLPAIWKQGLDRDDTTKVKNTAPERNRNARNLGNGRFYLKLPV